MLYVSDIQKALMCRQKSEIIVSYLARSKTKPTIRAIMARASTCMITSPEVSTTYLGTLLVLDNGIHVGILAITTSTTTRTAMATRQVYSTGCRTPERWSGYILKTWNFNSVVATRNLLLNTNIAFDADRILRSVA